MEKYCKLIMVTGENNNKYYIMEHDGTSSTFVVKYGRVESTETVLSYPIYDWDKKYNEKVKKGYKDVTEFVSIEKAESTGKKVGQEMEKEKDSTVHSFVTLMKMYTDKLVSTTYSVKATSVTQKQVDEAQSLIDGILKIKKTDIASINAGLLELYMIIPRYMGKVQHSLLPHIDLEETMIQEQDNLDAMKSQVDLLTSTEKLDETKETKKSTVLDVMGVIMKKLDKPNKDIEYLIKQLTRNKVESIFEVSKEKSEKVFDGWMDKQKNKATRYLLHGTRCTSVLPILEQGLKIRPSGNYQFSGKVYGDGNYFSEVCSKSLNYTGYDKDIVLLVFEVHTGNPFKYDGWYKGNSFSLTYNELNKRGYDSTHVNAGHGLLNSEIIAYKEEQCRPKYIIHLKR